MVIELILGYCNQNISVVSPAYLTGFLCLCVFIVVVVVVFVFYQLSFFLFVCSGSEDDMKNSNCCFIDSVCLLDLSGSISCFLLHFFVSSYTPAITSDLAASQPF